MHRFNSLQATLFLFLQALGLKVIFYPLILLNILRKPQAVVRSSKVMMGLVIMALTLLSLVMRGASVDLLVNVIRFYFGLLIVYIAFYTNPRLRITNASLWIFSIFNICEFLSFHLGLTFFTYSQINQLGVDSESRVRIGEGVLRVLGPALNSSVSGSILAISFFIGIKNFIQFPLRDKQNKYLLFFIFLAFLFTGSTTAWIVFIFCGVNHFLGRRKKIKLTYSAVYSFLFLALVFFALLQIELFGNLIETLISGKLSFDYINFVVNDKYLALLDNMGLSLWNIFLGADLLMFDTKQIGGDFAILNFIYLVGWPLAIIYFAYLMYLCANKFKFFLLTGLLASSHYGILFTLTGQVFFGALIAGSIYVNNQVHKNINDK